MAGREYGSLFSGRAGMRMPFQWPGGIAGAFSVVGRECGSLFDGRAGMREPF